MTPGHTGGTRHDLEADDLVLSPPKLGRPVPGIIRRLLLEIARRFTEAASLPDDVTVRAHLASVEEDVRQVLQWTKRAGPRKKPVTVGDRRLALHDEGLSVAEIAKRDGSRPEATRKSMARARQRRADSN